MMTSERYLVYFRNKRGTNLGIRTAEHTRRSDEPEKEFRLRLLQGYIGRKRRVIRIERIK